MASFYRAMLWLDSTELCLGLAREVIADDSLSLGTGTKAWTFAPDIEQLCPQFPPGSLQSWWECGPLYPMPLLLPSFR